LRRAQLLLGLHSGGDIAAGAAIPDEPAGVVVDRVAADAEVKFPPVPAEAMVAEVAERMPGCQVLVVRRPGRIGRIGAGPSPAGLPHIRLVLRAPERRVDRDPTEAQAGVLLPEPVGAGL